MMIGLIVYGILTAGVGFFLGILIMSKNDYDNTNK